MGLFRNLFLVQNPTRTRSKVLESSGKIVGFKISNFSLVILNIVGVSISTFDLKSLHSRLLE